MDPEGKFLVGWAIVLLSYMLLGGTVIYVLRRRCRYEPSWSWLRSLWAYTQIIVLGTMVAFVPVAGKVLQLFVVVAGFKYSTGYGFVRVFFLSLGILIFLLCVTALVGYLLGVDLTAFQSELEPE